MASVSSPNAKDSVIPYGESVAASMINKKGEVVSIGRKVTRLQLGGDSRFFVAAKVVSESGSVWNKIVETLQKFLGYYTEIKIGNDRLLVNINSIANRLHVKKADIYQAIKEEKLPSLLAQRAEVAQSTLVGYEKFLASFDEKSRGSLTSKTLMKVLRTAVKTPQPQSITLEIQSRTHHLSFDKATKEFELITLDTVFAKGSFGEVRTVTNVFQKTTEVMKQARIDREQKQARKDVQNEYDKLTLVHSKGQVWGIQAAPRRLVQITEGETEERFGYIGVKYEGDYFDEIIKQTRPLEKRLVDFHQLLSGLKTLADRNLLHGDLKTENILVKQESDGTQLVHIADLGGAQSADVSASSTDLKTLAGAGGSRSFTSTSSPYLDLIKANDLAANGKFDELVEVEKQRDVFSMGTILYQALTVTNPYDFDVRNFPDFNFFHPMNNSVAPQELRDLITSMLQEDAKKRPTAQEAFKTYEDYLQKNHLAIYATIQAKIQKEYPGSILAP